MPQLSSYYYYCHGNLTQESVNGIIFFGKTNSLCFYSNGRLLGYALTNITPHFNIV